MVECICSQVDGVLLDVTLILSRSYVVFFLKQVEALLDVLFEFGIRNVTRRPPGIEHVHVEEFRLGSSLRVVADLGEIGLSSDWTDPDLAILKLLGPVVLEPHVVHDLRRRPRNVWLSHSFTVAQFVRIGGITHILRSFGDLFTGPLQFDARGGLLARKA